MNDEENKAALKRISSYLQGDLNEAEGAWFLDKNALRLQKLEVGRLTKSRDEYAKLASQENLKYNAEQLEVGRLAAELAAESALAEATQAELRRVTEAAVRREVEAREEQREACAQRLEGNHRHADGNCVDRFKAQEAEGGTMVASFGSTCGNCSRAEQVRATPLAGTPQLRRAEAERDAAQARVTELEAAIDRRNREDWDVPAAATKRGAYHEFRPLNEDAYGSPCAVCGGQGINGLHHALVKGGG